MKQKATILWYDKRDGQGVALDAEGREYYIDRSVIDHPAFTRAGLRVEMDTRLLGDCPCGYNVRLDLGHAAELQHEAIAKLQAYPYPEHLMPDAITDALALLGAIMDTKRLGAL
jgi:hypothetical protein